jgi:hypothetical protein
MPAFTSRPHKEIVVGPFGTIIVGLAVLFFIGLVRIFGFVAALLIAASGLVGFRLGRKHEPPKEGKRHLVIEGTVKRNSA